MKPFSISDHSRESIAESMQQPQALKELSAFYCNGRGNALFERIGSGVKIIFAGEGMDHFIACMAAEMCCRAGVDARAASLTNLAVWPTFLLEQFSSVFIVSRSGSDPEIVPVLNRVSANRLLALTNNSDGWLANRAGLTLPVCAGPENDLALKSVTNALALVWLLSRWLSKNMDGSESEQLKRLRQHMQIMLEGQNTLFEQWQTCLGGAIRLVFTGSGYHALTAVQAVSMLAEWSGVQSAMFSLSSLSHNIHKLAGPDLAVIVFHGEWNENKSVLSTLQEAGATVIRVEDGFPLPLGAEHRPEVTIADELSPLLDILSCQLLAVYLAK